ncbi:helix-turn-helix domain-containing protein [Streptomyces clavifer]|uniref:helix-turn-helix domain-containing protein n=1 Tax=Streptomyces clavifer TaxID=68188 RepID=UPI0036491C44
MPQKTYPDPPGMPEGGRMTPAEFKVVREFLGVTGDWLAGYLEVSPRTVRNWEQGTYAIPEQLSDLPEPGVVTYRDDEEYHAAHP